MQARFVPAQMTQSLRPTAPGYSYQPGYVLGDVPVSPTSTFGTASSPRGIGAPVRPVNAPGKVYGGVQTPIVTKGGPSQPITSHIVSGLFS